MKTVKTDKMLRRFTLIELMVALALSMIIGAVALTAFTQTRGVGRLAHARIEAINNARGAMRIIEKDLRSAFIYPDGVGFVGIEDDYEYDPSNEPGEFFPGLELLTLSGMGGVTGPARVRYYLAEPDEEHEYADGYRLIRFGRSLNQWHGGNDLPDWWDEVEWISDPRDPPDGWAGIPARDAIDDDAIDDPDDPLTEDYMLAMNIVDFELVYYYGDGEETEWNSIGGSGAWTGNIDHRRLPEVVEVVIDAVDSRGVLDPEENEQERIRRFIEIDAGLTR